MTRLRLATIAPEVSAEVIAFAGQATHHVSSMDFRWKSLNRDVDRLANADPGHASILRAVLFQLTGDLHSAIYWLDNARNFPTARRSINAHKCAIHCNLGYFGFGAQNFSDAMLHDEWSDGDEVLSMGLMCGAWHEALKLSAEMPNIEFTTTLMSTIRRSIMIAEKLEVSPEQIRAVLDVAGEVLRRHSIFYSGDRPSVYGMNDSDGTGLLYEIALPVDSAEADRMTDEVISELIDREILLPGFAFSFVPAAA